MGGSIRRRLGPALVAAVIASVMAVGASAQAAALPFRITGAVTNIGSPDEFSGSSVRRSTDAQRTVEFSLVRYYIVRDSNGNNKYSFQLEAIGAPAVVAAEIAFDADRHQQLIAVGTPTAASLARLTKMVNQPRAASSAKPGSGATTNGSPSVAALTRGHDFFGTFWTDPIGITVNDVVDEAKFYYDGTKVSSLVGYDGRQWLSGNGWWEVSHSISAFYNAAHTLGTVSTYDNFRTSSWFPFPFCGTTNVYYSTNKVYAYPDGHPGGAVTTWQTGTCGFLLSYTAMAFRGT